jgi:hypothetical protein
MNCFGPHHPCRAAVVHPRDTVAVASGAGFQIGANAREAGRATLVRLLFHFMDFTSIVKLNINFQSWRSY